MALLVEPTIKNGKILDKPSIYNPSQRVIDRFKDIRSDFQTAEQIMNQDYEEFGSKDLISYQNDMQKRFNNNIPPISDDPNQEWRANTIRPLTRNKVISIVAHITGSVIYPNVIAQNEKSVEDKDMSLVMRDCIEWACEQSKYEDMFISAVIDMCINPAIILYQDYAIVKRKVKEIIGKDKWELKEIVDEIYSGFLNQIIPCDELYIGNIYEPNIQKQPFLIRVKNIDYSAAKLKYGDNDNWQYVQKGLRIFLNTEEDTFYQQDDESLKQRLIQEVIYYNRFADLELRILSGVMMDDPDRPIQRKDKLYPFAKSFYEQFNSRFFYGMPLVAKLKPDQDTIDTLYNMVIDGTFMQIMPPTAIYGTEQVDSSVFMPGTTISFKDVNTKIEPISNGGNLAVGFNLLNKLEASASESSQDPLQSGQAMGGDRTKYEVERLEQNAKTVLGLTGKMIVSLVRDFGQLLVGSIVQYLPISEIEEITGDDVKLKFPTIFMKDRQVRGKTMSRRIDFTNQMPETPEEMENLQYDMMAEEDNTGMQIIKVNPEMFRKMKYLMKVEPDFLDKATKFFKKVQIYDRAIQNPLANQEAIFRDFLLNAYVPGEEDKYIAKQGDQIMQQVQQMANMKQPNQQFINKTEIKSPNQSEI
jgi:hypothetical protein